MKKRILSALLAVVMVMLLLPIQAFAATEEIKGGYTDRMSFAFVVSDQKRETEMIGGKTVITRRITGISKLYDVSAVSMPANDSTSISARSFVDGVIAELEAERLHALKIARMQLKLKLLEG